jgi:hypothetical protein
MSASADTRAVQRPWLIAATIAWVIMLGWFFAEVEIQIEGPTGWAAGLPTWRIEHHWLLDLFWGGRAMTGYHAWVFPFIALVFHFPFLLLQQWSWKLQARAIACIALFWVSEDLLWFLLNPAYGWARFDAAHADWHKHWLAGAPVEYWWGSVMAVGLLVYSYRLPSKTDPVAQVGRQ